MEVVQRILSKIVGAKISVEETELVAGGRLDECRSLDGYRTYPDIGGVICDFES